MNSDLLRRAALIFLIVGEIIFHCMQHKNTIYAYNIYIYIQYNNRITNKHMTA